MQKQTSRRLLVAGAVALGALGAWRFFHGSASNVTADDPSLIDGRLWVDARPEKHTDYVQAAIFLSRSHFGIFERASSYDLHLEFFDLQRDGNKARIFFPQTEKDNRVSFAVKECNDKPPFDLCLDLNDNPWKGAPKRYYGFRNPENEDKVLGPVAKMLRRGGEL